MKRTCALLCLMAVTITKPVQSSRLPSYIPEGSVDLRQFISPAPAPGSLLEERDREFFRSDRPADHARWRSAAMDVDEAVPSMMRDFSAAVGVSLTPQRFPRLAHLLLTMRHDIGAAVDAVKPLYARPRPFLRDEGPVCQDKVQLARSFDYPSGHTTWGTSVALVLTELWPARASAILARGRAYGESRYICGAHSVSAVEAGRQAAGALVAVLHGSQPFREDLDAARQEASTVR